ncbi:MAG: GNAT family N-acetyltransferase [Burkholderiaceae bacterium]
MSLNINAARRTDIDVLHRLIRGLAEYERLEHQVVGTVDDLKRELFADQPIIEAVIAWEDERAVGFALYFHNYSTFLARRGLYLEDLFVVPEARGRGVGKALIRHCAQLAVARGCGRFEWAVLDWNQPAIDFYQSIGATVLQDWRICRLTGDALSSFARSQP